MGRESIKVLTAFRDHLKWILAHPKFPIKTLGEFATLVSLKWIKDYNRSSEDQKKQMRIEIEEIRKEAEQKQFLENSKEVFEDE